MKKVCRYEVEQQAFDIYQQLGYWLVVSRHDEYDKANQVLDGLRVSQKRARIIEVIEERNIVAATILP